MLRLKIKVGLLKMAHDYEHDYRKDVYGGSVLLILRQMLKDLLNYLCNILYYRNQ